MRMTTKLGALAASVALAATGALVAAPAASASSSGDTPLSDVLLPANSGFDNNHWNYNIVTNAVLAVVTANPDSPVADLTNGDVALTAFIPRDIAFYRLVEDLTGKWPTSEKAAFNTVASLGIPTVEKVLEYHIVPGPAIDSGAALGADGAKLKTQLGQTFMVDVINRSNGSFGIRLIDNNPDLRNPWVAKTQLDINAGNMQIAHGIGRVLMPKL